MKASLTAYLSVLANDGTLKGFRDILVQRYKKFIRLYSILKKWSGAIVGLSYDDDVSTDILTVDVELAGVDADKLLRALTSTNWDSSDISFSKIGRSTINITIQETEDTFTCD